MKFFHLSDLHIGLKLINRDLREDQAHILGQIAQAAGQERPDAVVIAGDLYDKSIPSAEAVELFDRFVWALTQAAPGAEIMMISGNHDSAARVNMFRGVLRRQRVHMIGLPPLRPGDAIERVALRDAYGPVNFYLLPFVKPSMVRQIVDPDGEGLSYDETVRRLIEREAVDPLQRNVLVSHQFYLPAGVDPESVERTDSEARTVGNIDEVCADVLRRFDYAALGHLHRPMTVGGERWRYCGAPLACSVSEAGQRKGIVCVELGEKGRVDVRTLPLRPLRQIRRLRGALEEVLAQRCGDYVSVTLTDRDGPDAADAMDRLLDAFPCLLEVRREAFRAVNPAALPAAAEADPFDLCRDFLPDLDGDEQALLREVINAVREVNP